MSGLARGHLPVRQTDPASVYDCGGAEVLPGTLVDIPASNDPTCLRASEFARGMLDFMRQCFGRDSYDDKHAPVVSSVHYSRIFSNAYWNGEQMVYGDGDGLMILDFTLAPEFIGHEIFHAVTEHTCALAYDGEAGALNESMSDVFGSVFQQWRSGETVDRADWKFGNELMGPTALALGWSCVRSLAEPSAVWSMTRQPSHYSHYDSTGGPHDNSGIPNHAFYLAAMATGGESWKQLAPVWYASLLDRRAHPRLSFQEFAALTVEHAKKSFSGNADLAAAVRIGWNRVGVIC